MVSSAHCSRKRRKFSRPGGIVPEHWERHEIPRASGRFFPLCFFQILQPNPAPYRVRIDLRVGTVRGWRSLDCPRGRAIEVEHTLGGLWKSPCRSHTIGHCNDSQFGKHDCDRFGRYRHRQRVHRQRNPRTGEAECWRKLYLHHKFLPSYRGDVCGDPQTDQ